MEPLANLLTDDWNPLCKTPLSQWLLHERDSEWEMRVHACGNVVVPRQAMAGLQLLARIHERH